MTGPSEPTPPTEVRPYRAGDEPAIATLGAAADLRRGRAATPAGVRDEVVRADRVALVAAEGGEVIGYAVALATPPGEDAAWELLELAVEPSRRRRGIARMLLACLVGEAAVGGAGTLVLEVRAVNTAARHLYRSLGGTQIGRRPRYYPDGEDAVLLALPVAPPRGG